MQIIGPDLKKAVNAIKEGKVLVCPTDTVYGLICDAGKKEAVARLYKIKRRPKNKPIPMFVSDISMAKKIAEIGGEEEKFLKKVWPGPVTAVLEKKGGGTIGIRIPNHKFLLDLVKQNGPLAETSANISGRPASGKFKEVLEQFALSRVEGPDLAIDAGDLPLSKPSQVLDLKFSPPKILRQ